MLYLLDAHILIWAVADTARLSRQAYDLIGEPDNQIVFSAASIWEIAIKVRQGRTDFNFEPATILSAALATGFVERPITAAVALYVRNLPDHHRDPFDRLLIAQAIEAGAEFLTSDTALPVYSPLVRLV